MTVLQRERGADGILVVTFDVPGSRVNTLGKVLLEEFEGLIGELEATSNVRGVVLRSGKPDNFIAGADIKDFVNVRSALEGETLSRTGQAILSRVEALRIPVVAAIHGSCLGGGLETALVCRYRIASDDSRTVLGFPEGMLGLIPGAGGTQRLPRLVGYATALEMILSHRNIKAPRALKAGVVDEVVPVSILVDVARRAALALAEGQLRPVRKGPTLLERALRPVVFRRARAAVWRTAKGHYPAPLRAVDVIEQGTATSLEGGLKIEARAFGELLVSDVSRALVSVFFATQDIKKDAGYPEGTATRDVRKLGVVGAGLMGAGIAGAAVEAGLPVRVKDTSFKALGHGLGYVRGLLEGRRKRGGLSRLEIQKRMDRLSPTLEYSGFRQADLVIEAVFEDLDLKRRVLGEVELAASDGCVLASNTSSLPIGAIARGSRNPSRVLGMHFFSPVHRMPLLEVIVTPETDAWATATAVNFGRRLGKHVIVVRDGPGFYTTRVLAPYLNESARLLEEGAAIEDVDRALESFGFPVGPLALLDEVGIDVGSKVAKILHDHFGDRLSPPVSLSRILEDGRLGRKNKRGFYIYNDRKRADESIYSLLSRPREARPFDRREIQDRLVFLFLNEAVRCLEDGILRSPRDGDVGAIFGLGFPAFLGGPFRYLDHLGGRFGVETLERLRTQHGDRFQPAALLVDQAKADKAFYGASDRQS
jgi:3-hydroxyacyl-CoA dehydrogenase/enoyl-CoA hydratase/3-hydroxybutyryl-CoA epimerase